MLARSHLGFRFSKKNIDCSELEMLLGVSVAIICIILFICCMNQLGSYVRLMLFCLHGACGLSSPFCNALGVSCIDMFL